MCGRYVVVSKIEQIEKKFNANFLDPGSYKQSANVAAGDFAPVICGENKSEIRNLRFGFTPHWAGKQMYQINARAEGDYNKDNSVNYSGNKGIFQKPMFRSSVRSKRCLVIADAFIEGSTQKGLEEAYVIYRRDKKRPFAFAGIWDSWVNKSTGEIIDSFAIITSHANEITQKVNHHRSPVILNESDYNVWLNPGSQLSEISELLTTFNSNDYNAYPISSDIKPAKNKGLELLRPIGNTVYTEYDYKLSDELKLQGMGHTQARQRRLFDLD